jgi:hypothetical protein
MQKQERVGLVQKQIITFPGPFCLLFEIIPAEGMQCSKLFGASN